MRAIRVHEFGGAELMELNEIPDSYPDPGQILIKIAAIGVNPVDTYIRSGVYAALPDLPYIPGGDAAGTVEAVGAGVAEFSIGDRVYMASVVGGHQTGATAEKAVVPARELFHLPDNVSFATGASIGVPYATAYYGLFTRGQARPGETVFIHGASGAVGTAAIQLARARGLTVIGSAGSDRGRHLVNEQGAHHVLDHTSDSYMRELMSLTVGGPDLILEMLANVNLARDLEAVAKYGRIIVIGNRGEIQINPRMTMMKDADIRGLALNNCSNEEMNIIHAALGAGLENGTLKPVIGREMKLSEAADAHVAVLGPGAYGKIVLVP
jgi:NADPH:quinone reductase